jgi:WD40 repeat protein
VERLAVSPDRTRIVASGASTHVEAWDARSGLRLFQAEGHSEHVEAIAFTDDGRFLLTGSREPRARLEERDGQLVSTGSGEPEGVRILVRDARTCAPIQSHTMAQRLARAKSLSLAPGGRHLVTVDWLRGLATTINVWDPQTGCALGALYEGRESADVLAFSPDGRYCLVALSDNTARLWDLAKRRPIVQLTFKAPVSAGAVSSEGKYVALLVAGPGRGSYRLYVADATRRALLRTIGWREHQHRPNRLTGKDRAAFSPDGGMLVSTADGTLKMWNWAKEKLVCQLAAAGPVTFNKDGRYLYAGAGSQVKVWSFERLLRRPPPVAPTKNAVEALASTPDGGQVAAGSRDGVVSIWDPRTERRLRTLEADSLRVTALTFSPDGALLASASDDRTVRIWDVEASCLIQTITREDINSMAFGQERKTLITAKHSFSGRPVIDAWDVRSGEKLGAPLPLRTQRVYARLNPRGDRVLIIDHGDTGTACLELWDRRRQRQLWRCCEPRVDRRAVAFTPEGRHIVARDRKGRIVTFDASTGQVDQVFPRDPLLGWGPCFLDVSTDGALILGAGAKTLTLWDRRTGRRVASFSSDKRMVPCRVLHLPSGYLIAAGGEQLRFLKLVGYAVQSR